jgi:hypothetical protein
VGSLTDRTSLWITLLCAVIWLLVSTLLAIPFPIRPAEGLNLAPAENWPDPVVKEEIDLDGPVVVMIEYQVDIVNVFFCRQVIDQLVRLHLRDGAL